jgi:hypothetical protein
MALSERGIIGTKGAGPVALIGGDYQEFLPNAADYMAMLVSGSSGSPDDGLAIVNVADPDAPFYVARTVSAALANSGVGVVVRGDRAYIVANQAGGFGPGLAGFDVSNPTIAPPYLGGRSVLLPTTPYASDYEGRYAYVMVDTNTSASGGESLQIVDLDTLTIVGSLSSTLFDWPGDIEVHGDIALVVSIRARRLVKVNVSNRAAPSVLGSVTVPAGSDPRVVSWDPVNNLAAVITQNFTSGSLANRLLVYDVSTNTPVLLQNYNVYGGSSSSSGPRMVNAWIGDGYMVTTIDATSGTSVTVDSIQGRTVDNATGAVTLENTLGGWANFRHIKRRGDFFYVAKQPGLAIFHREFPSAGGWTVGSIRF